MSIVDKKLQDMVTHLRSTNQMMNLLDQKDLIGKGGFGKVYRYHNPLDNRIYAIKQILITSSSVRAALHEIRILAAIHHQHIVRYFHSWIAETTSRTEDDESDEEEDRIIWCDEDRFLYFCIQMEFCIGSVRHYITNRTHVDGHINHMILSQTLSGLQFLHNNQIIHRDLKPDNLLIQSFDPLIIKIADFGLAKTFQPRFTSTESTMYTGSFFYASPEQYHGKSYSFSSDIFSVGVIWVELSCRFKTESERIVMLRRLSIPIIPEECSPYTDIITSMLCHDPNMRPSIHSIRFSVDPYFHDHVLWCRDIVWNIIHRVFCVLE